jgi:TPR repeat protein
MLLFVTKIRLAMVAAWSPGRKSRRGSARRKGPRHEANRPTDDVAIISYTELRALSPNELQGRLAKNPVEAARLISAAARYGFPEAQLMLGQMLLDGIRLDRDHPTAIRWFRRAAEAGSAEAMNMVGRCFELGWGVTADPATAASWYRKAADLGLDWGQYNLANRLLRGDGVPRDRRAALALYRQAAASGHAKSMNLIARFLEEGWEIPRDPVQALAWYRRSAEAGDFRGQYNLAVALTGMGRSDEARGWFRVAIEHGSPGFLETVGHDLSGREEPWLRNLGVLALSRLARGGPREAAEPAGTGGRFPSKTSNASCMVR